MLVVVDELWDAAEIMFLCQVKLSLCGGTDVIMSATSSGFPVERQMKRSLQKISDTNGYQMLE